MKTTRFKILSSVIMVVISLCSMPLMAIADTVPWSSELYIANASSLSAGTPVYGPPLPISDSYTLPSSPANTSSSTITTTNMEVQSTGFSTDLPVWARASFSGTYIAPAVNTLFQFTYDGTFTSLYPSTSSARYAWLTVDDVTTGTVLYDNSSLALDGSVNYIGVSAIAGHEISVDFGAYSKSYVAPGSAIGPNYEKVSLNYSTAVAPEPISSILFLTGGTLLAGRRFIRRKA
jgi:hypothetical protein